MAEIQTDLSDITEMSDTPHPPSDRAQQNEAAAAADEALTLAAVEANAAVEAGQIDTAGLEEKLKDAQDQLLRSQADFENYRKRIQGEMEEQRRFAASSLLQELLPVVDNLERALEAFQQNHSETPEMDSRLLEGVRMVAQHLSATLEQHNCRRIETAPGSPFDPHLHEALSQHPSHDHPAGAVTQVVRSGYQLHDRVIRPVQVMVSSGSPTSDD